MKYMGSKRAMLSNGLGELLHETVSMGRHFHDLFCGTAAVASYVASNFPVRVCATDLQSYAVTLAASQLEKDVPVDADKQMQLGFTDVINPYTLLGGLATAGLFLLHGAAFLALKTAGEVRTNTLALARTMRSASARLRSALSA